MSVRLQAREGEQDWRSRQVAGNSGGKPSPPSGGHDERSGYVFFSGWSSEHGVLCQWYRTKFTVSNAQISSVCGEHLGASRPEEGTTFHCVWLCIMYCKAALFSDTEKQRMILWKGSRSPSWRWSDQSRVANCVESEWRRVEERIVEMANYAKFSQDERLKQYLLDTGDRELVKTSGYDRIWGIGFEVKTREQEERAVCNRHRWGENRLGRALERVRARLRDQEGDEHEHEREDGDREDVEMGLD